MNKKKLGLWALYDFANSFVFINFLVYFAAWIVIDGGLSDFWYNAIFAITSILLLFTAPMLANRIDRVGGRKKSLIISTLGVVVGYAGAAWMAYLGSAFVVWAAFFFLVGQYFYQLSFVFYNPMIVEIDETGRHRARATGFGQASNYLGQIVGLLVTLPFAASRPIPLLLSVVLFVILSLPMLIFYKESKINRQRQDARPYQGSSLKRFTAFWTTSAATAMLISFFFFNDALLTISNNYSIYLERVFGKADNIKSMLLMLILLMGIAGSLVAGRVADRIGRLRTLRYALFGWLIAIPLMAVTPLFPVFVALTVVIGFLMGAIWTVTRAYISTVLKADEMNYGFSFYTIAERFATLVGPLTWGGLIAFLGTSPSAYRITMATMTIFIILGIAILAKSKEVATSSASESNIYP